MLNFSSQRLVPVEVALSHFMSSLVMLIRWWLDHGMPYPPERMGQIVAELIIRPVIGALPAEQGQAGTNGG
jgi:hypothetical protein